MSKGWPDGECGLGSTDSAGSARCPVSNFIYSYADERRALHSGRTWCGEGQDDLCPGGAFPIYRARERLSERPDKPRAPA